MRRAAAGLALLALLAACSGGSKPGTAKPDLTALRAAAALAPCPTGIGHVPHLVLPCLGGGPDVTLDSGASGTPTLVNVYGSWCGPCQDEMPVLAQLSKRAAGKVAIVGVDTEDEPRLALLFAKDVGQTWAAVQDDDGTLLRHYASGPPITLFLDPAGMVVYVHRGPFKDLAGLVAEVKRRLGVSV